jgi:hypothetical protein
MTFEQWMRDRLTNSGMFVNQVDAVVERVKAAPENEPMAQRWGHSINGYPAAMVNVLWLTVKTHALEYIDAECPQAWFRPLFAPEKKV